MASGHATVQDYYKSLRKSFDAFDGDVSVDTLHGFIRPDLNLSHPQLRFVLDISRWQTRTTFILHVTAAGEGNLPGNLAVLV